MFTQDERKYGRMNYGEKLGVSADGRRIYLQPDGSYPKIGQVIRNPDLADTLRLVARTGPPRSTPAPWPAASPTTWRPMAAC